MESQIPVHWIELYVEQLREASTRFTDPLMKASATSRAEAVLDMVEAWRTSLERRPA